MSWSTEMRLESIVVGDRARKDLGDIDALMASINQVGLIHPPAVDLEHNLVAGARRLEALRRLGWDKTLVTVIRTRGDALRNLQIERDENTCRQPLLPSESADLANRMWALEAEKSLANKAEGGRAKASGNFPDAGQTRDRIAEAVTGGDMSGRTLEKARTVTHAATDPDLPEPVREVARRAVREMDATGKVDAAYRKVRDAKAQAELDHRYRQAIEEFPELTPATSPGLPPAEVVDIADAIRDIPEGPERDRRRQAAATWHEVYGDPATDEPDPLEDINTLVDALRLISHRIDELGGADRIAATIADSVPADLRPAWLDEFARCADLMAAIAGKAAGQKLRRVK